MTDDPKTSIAAGMESLMKRVIRETKTPEEREADDRVEAQKLRDAALLVFLNRPASRFWWVLDHMRVRYVCDRMMQDSSFSIFDAGVYDCDDLVSRIIPSEDAEPFDLFKAMEPEAQRRYLDKMRGAAIPPAIHPMQLADLATGEYHVAS
jgi:hypothetical protein